MIQHVFETGMDPTCAHSNTLVLIPKPEPGHVHEIRLLEPLWKLISALVNLHLMANITFYNNLHSFLHVHCTGTACLEAKLATQLAYCTGHPLHHVYIGFAITYNLLDHRCTLTLLADYGVGPNMLWLISLFWAWHMVIL